MRPLLLCFMILAASPSFAADKDKIVGTWKLSSVDYEVLQSKDRGHVLGVNPRGYQILTPDGRWIAIVATEKRSVPKNDAERLQNFRTLVAYSGRYTLGKGKISTMLDVASNEAWVGTEQIIDFKFETDDVLEYIMPTEPYPGDPKKRVRIVITWKRDKSK
jgi:hypothetical protein